MTFGPQAKKIVDAAREQGLPAPESCLPPVLLSPHQERLLEAFWELSSTRQIHMAGAGPIPWNVIDAFAERHGYVEDPELYDDLMAAVRGLDEEFLTIQNDAAKRKLAELEAKGARGRGRSPRGR